MTPSAWIWSCLIGLICGAALWLLGIAPSFALAAAGLPMSLALVRAATLAAPPPTPVSRVPPGPVTTSGTRADLARLSWSLRARKGRVGHYATARLRRAAIEVLRSHGCDPNDPNLADAVEESLGPDIRALLIDPDLRLSPSRYTRLVRRLSAFQEEKCP